MTRSTRVGPPWSVQLELVEGCNRACSFCGINAIRPDGPGQYQYQGRAVAEMAAPSLARLCPTARYEFAMHGEPLQHKQAAPLIALYRQHLPAAQFQLTTNGRVALARGMPATFLPLFDAGIDLVVLDTYAPEREALQAAVWAIPASTGITVVDFYRDWAPAQKSPWTNYRRKVQRTIVVMDDLGIRDGETANRVINNMGGNNPERPWPETPLARTCTIPFRELAINFNGDVNICCNDWGHEYVCGNVLRQDVADIWWSPAFEAARKVLQQRDRGFSPCNRCDVRSGPRVGLLPLYPAPEAADRAALAQTVHAPTATNGHAPYLAPHWQPDGPQ